MVYNAMYFALAFNKASIELIQYCSVLGIAHIRVMYDIELIYLEY